MSHVRRIATVAATTAVLVGSLATGAAAETLADVLERTQGSTYTADRLTVSIWGGETQIAKASVEHADGTEMVRIDSTWSMVGNGRAMVLDESPDGVAFMTHAQSIETNRYTIGETRPARHMQRDCTVVPVYEGKILRATLLVDDHTGASLISQYFAEDGSTFRRNSLQNFRAYRTYDAPRDVRGTYEVLMPMESELLPEEVAGYELVDVFRAPAESAQGFYSDGLFSFSLFVFTPGTDVTGFQDAKPYVLDSGTYDARPTPQDVRIHWTAPDHEYVLVGDLPPDHVADVLAELPAPDARSIFARLWNALFG